MWGNRFDKPSYDEARLPHLIRGQRGNMSYLGRILPHNPDASEPSLIA